MKPEATPKCGPARVRVDDVAAEGSILTRLFFSCGRQSCALPVSGESQTQVLPPGPSSSDIYARHGSTPRPAKEFPWTKEEDALLGTVPDRDVAEKLNRKLACVRGRRTMLGKTAFGHAPARLRYEREPRDRYAELFASKSNAELRRILGWTDKRIRTRRRHLAAGHVRNRGPEWTIEEDQLLGTKPDEVIARQIGRPVRAVRSRRWQKRIRLRKGWRPEDDKILGDRIDKVTGLLLGRQAGNVSWRRRKLGIAAKGNRPWTAEEEALLGTKPARDLAREFRRTFTAGQVKRIQLGRPKPDARSKVIKVKGSAVPGSSKIQSLNVKPHAAYCTWTPEEDALLGKITDQEIAARLGCSVRRVNLRRRRLGLHNPNPDHRHWTTEDIALLGTAPDSEIAGR
jgi:hypothetical protein